jgi:pyruvate dehydrogenase (quinone)
LIGDSRETLTALLPLLKPKADNAWREKIEKGQKGWRSEEDARCHVKGDLINPQLVFWELNERLPDNAILPVTRARRRIGLRATFRCGAA